MWVGQSSMRLIVWVGQSSIGAYCVLQGALLAWSAGGFAHLVCRGLCSPGLQGALLTWSAGGLVCRGLCSPGLQGALLTWSGCTVSTGPPFARVSAPDLCYLP